MFRTIVLATLLAASASSTATDAPLGRWKTIDDATGATKSIVEIYRASDGTLAGRVADILDTRNGTNPACDKCSGARRGKPIKGMVILWGLKPDGTGKWAGGRVLDPENGKDYKARIELMDAGRKLGMSGCIAVFCRQQVWRRE